MMKPETVKSKHDWNIKKVHTEQTNICSKTTVGNTRTRWAISSKLTIKTLERFHWLRSDVFISWCHHIIHKLL